MTRITWKLKNKETDEVFDPPNGVWFLDADGEVRKRDCQSDCLGDWIMEGLSDKYEVVDIRINTIQ